ncbi:MAG: helix-turn-helix domain-containing protein [Candidatus Omnitrophica bacterium]|nr:helix-turn-helix domain-containing protein [Candidatus Omnitrophota bacterium]
MAKDSNKEDKMLSVKDIMREYNLTYQTVNHYTDFGLLPIALKKGNVRFYDKNIVDERIKKIKKLTEEGYSLSLIRKQLIGI